MYNMSDNNSQNGDAQSQNGDSQDQNNSQNNLLSTISTIVIPPITQYTLNETISSIGTQVTNQQGTGANNEYITQTTFSTIDTNNTIDPDISENLGQVISSYYDNEASEASQVVNEIRTYAEKINCDSFKGKGTIEDYSELFVAASKIANETKHMQLNVEIEGFNDFAAAADELSALFQGFIVKLQSINIIDDLNFLKSVSAALKKIANLSDVFGQFKQTIFATASVQMPKSARDTRLIIQNVMSNINCSMGYINNFVNPDSNAPSDAQLSVVERNVIDTAVSTIENWKILCDQDINVSMSNNPDVVYIKQASDQLKNKANSLRANTNILRAKFAIYKNI